MAVLVRERIERPPALFGPRSAAEDVSAPIVDDAARERDGGLGGGLTLDDAIVGVWEGLAAQLVVACPMCGGRLRPHAAPDTVGGRCGACETALD
jgi:hypothetical protein